MEAANVTTSPIILTNEHCLSLFDQSNQAQNGSFCPAFFDRIGCWPPTPSGTLQRIICPSNMFPDANDNAYAARFCTNESRWEERGEYGLCIGCPTQNISISRYNGTFSLPTTYVHIRRNFIIGANCFSMIFLLLGIVILLGNRKLRSLSRNILHVNLFLVFFIRSVVQLIAELYMSNGYFQHNVFERVDACNRTHIYFQETALLDCQLFTVFANYINSSVSHWFVFCEALFLFRLLRVRTCKDRIKVYVYVGWFVPLLLVILTYSARVLKRENMNTCWFEPSVFDWILHGPNVILQILNFIIFNYICILLARKLNDDYRIFVFVEPRRFAKYGRLARSTLILLPLFSIHYFLFMWNTRPLLIPRLILIHLTVHTISSSLQGFMVAFIYTLMNGEVQRELLRSVDRWFVQHHSSWQQPKFLRNYMHKLENRRLYSCAYTTRSSTQVQSRALQMSSLYEDCSYLEFQKRPHVNHATRQVLINKNSESGQSTSTN